MCTLDYFKFHEYNWHIRKWYTHKNLENLIFYFNFRRITTKTHTRENIYLVLIEKNHVGMWIKWNAKVWYSTCSLDLYFITAFIFFTYFFFFHDLTQQFWNFNEVTVVLLLLLSFIKCLFVDPRNFRWKSHTCTMNSELSSK